MKKIFWLFLIFFFLQNLFAQETVTKKPKIGLVLSGGGAKGLAQIGVLKVLEQAGAALLLLECVPSTVAAQVTASVSIPVIGIGAGKDCNGQVLVVHDMLGLSQGKPARFVKNFLAGQDSIQGAFSAYVAAVKNQSYPAPEHGFN